MLVASFFGPRHGRLLQAKFNKSGALQVRASKIYGFRHRDEAPTDLFLRYYACKPRDGEEFEFHSDNEEEDAPTQAPEYVPLPADSEKENVPPEDDDIDLSAESP